MRVVTFKIDESLLEELDRYCMKERITRSEAIRKAIIELLRGFKEERKPIRIRRVVIW